MCWHPCTVTFCVICHPYRVKLGFWESLRPSRLLGCTQQRMKHCYTVAGMPPSSIILDQLASRMVSATLTSKTAAQYKLAVTCGQPLHLHGSHCTKTVLLHSSKSSCTCVAAVMQSQSSCKVPAEHRLQLHIRAKHRSFAAPAAAGGCVHRLECGHQCSDKWCFKIHKNAVCVLCRSQCLLLSTAMHL